MKFIKIFLFTVLAIFSIGFFSNQVAAASGSGSITVSVVTPPTAALSADATTISYNSKATLHILATEDSASTGDFNYCTLSWTGGSSTGGASWNYTTSALTSTTTYSLICYGVIGGASSASTVTINVTAQPKYTVTGTAGTGGSISPASQSINSGSTTTLTITPSSGYTASASGCGGSLSGTTYTTGAITADCTVTATFTNIKYTVTGTAGTGGSISPASQSINSGSTTTLTITPSSGYTASASGCGGSLSGTTYTTGAITADCTVTATFTLKATAPSVVTGLTVATSISPSSCGNNWLNISWNASSGATSYQVYRDGGTSAVYDGSSTSFSDTGLVLGQTYSYTVRATNSVGSSALSGSVSGTVANACPFTLSITTAGTGSGTVTGAGSYTSGKVATITATPNATSTFVGWSGNADCTDGSVTMDADKSCIATFTTVGSISVSISASLTSIILPTSSTTLSWTTTGTPDSCTASNAWSGSKNASSGSEVRSGMTAGTYNYVITCSKSGTSDATANVSVIVYPQPPVITLTASPTTGTSPLSSTLSWTVSGGATSCTASNGWSGSKSVTGGSQAISGISSSTTYILVCANTGGNSNIASVTVNPTLPVGAISVAISASPTSITLPTSSTTLTWTTGGSPDSCTASNAWSGSKTASGGSEVRTGMTAGTYKYVITCSKAGTADATANVSVVVNPAVVGTISVSISASPTSMTLPTSSTTLTWTTAGTPTSCTASNAWTGTKTATGGTEVKSGLAAGTYKYVITCSKAGTTDATANVSVVVNPVTIVIPTTPTGLTATASVTPSICGNDWLNIAWNASTGATSYQVYRDGGATAVYNGSATAFSDTGLVLGSTHTYKVKATNSVGSSALSPSASGTVAPVCKFALTIIKAGTGTGTVAPTSGTTYSSGAVVALTATPNASSTFVGWTGNADCTDGSVTMDAAKSCTATFNTTVVGAISVVLSAVPSTMTLPVSSTTLKWTTTGTPTSCTASNAWTGTKTATGGTEVKSGLAAGTYKYVITCSKAGTTDATANVSVVVNPVTIVIPPTPTGLTATASVTPSPCGNDWLNLSWNISTGATSYQFYRDGSATPIEASTLTNYSCNATYCAGSDKGLTLGSTHTYKVRATNSAGSSARSASVSGTVAPVCPMSPSGNLTILPTSCLISLGNKTCFVVGATWKTTNANNPALLDGNIGGGTLSTLKNNDIPLKVYVAHPQTVINLKDGASILDTVTITASCEGGTKWSDSDDSCIASIIVPPCTNGATNPPTCTINTDGSCNNGETPPDCISTVKTDGYWTPWSPLPNGCSGSILQTSNYIKATNDGVDDPAGLINPTKTRNYTYDQCPVANLDVKLDGKTINDGTTIPYNSKVVVDWSALNATGGCTCTYSDSIKTDASCGSTGPVTSSPLKRDTTYTVVCKGDYNLTSLDSFKVLVGKINTNYKEQ